MINQIIVAKFLLLVFWVPFSFEFPNFGVEAQPLETKPNMSQESESLSCLVAGATGATGGEILRLLLGKDKNVGKVVVLARSEASAAKLQAIIIDQISATGSSMVEIVRVLSEDYESKSETLRNVFSQKGPFDIVFTAMGTSRVNPEVQEAMEEYGLGLGFEKFLKKVDLGFNLALAELALENGVKLFSRISARGANADGEVNPDIQWSYYPKYQGLADKAIMALPFPKGVHILRPGRLDRGEEFRKLRPHEVGAHEKMGPGLSVTHVARKAVAMALADSSNDVISASAAARIKIVDEAEIVQFSKREEL